MPSSTNTALIPMLVVFMLLTGVCNTLLTKLQDNICVRDCDDPERTPKLFEQPVIQTLQMFVGEMGCWLIIAGLRIYQRYASRRSADYQAVNSTDPTQAGGPESSSEPNPAIKVLMTSPDGRAYLRGWRVVLLALPAICDICGTTLMNVGLLFVVPSIYQMTRGALVLFVGLGSVLFLGRRLHLSQWFALATVVIGVGIVGLAGALYKEVDATSVIVTMTRETAGLAIGAARSPEAIRTIVGILLIAGAQIFTASQFVVEEYILEQYALEPLKVVGWEGIFGFSVTALAMVILHLAIGRTHPYGYFNIVEGWREITHYRGIGITSILIMISIGGYNFFGLSVTRNVSATARSVIDTSRTLFIWIVSLFLGWESFKWLQVVGFGMLVYGTFLFNGLVRPPLQRCVVRERSEEEAPLLAEEPIEHM